MDLPYILQCFPGHSPQLETHRVRIQRGQAEILLMSLAVHILLRDFSAVNEVVGVAVMDELRSLRTSVQLIAFNET